MQMYTLIATDSLDPVLKSHVQRYLSNAATQESRFLDDSLVPANTEALSPLECAIDK